MQVALGTRLVLVVVVAVAQVEGVLKFALTIVRGHLSNLETLEPQVVAGQAEDRHLYVGQVLRTPQIRVFPVQLETVVLRAMLVRLAVLEPLLQE